MQFYFNGIFNDNLTCLQNVSHSAGYNGSEGLDFDHNLLANRERKRFEKMCDVITLHVIMVCRIN